MSTTSSNLTVGAKYQKLINEYSKLRNQVPVLKKAVIAEQTKNSDLTEDLKHKDQQLRKCDAEIESLTFRNQQLTKRVESLQTMINEIQVLNRSGSKMDKKLSHPSLKSSKLPNSQSDFNFNCNNINESDNNKIQILEEELKRKLLENENLHRQIHEQELNHEQNKRVLGSRIENLLYQQKQENEKVREVLHNGKTNLISPSHTRSPETCSIENCGSISEEANDETRDYAENSPNCSNYSSIASSSNACDRPKENNQLRDLQQQLKEKQQRLAELEKEKEKLSLENQLLLVKFGTKRSSTTSDNVSSSLDASLTPTKDDFSRLTEEFYGKKLTELSVRLQEEQSKILHYDNECRNLLTQLETAKWNLEELNSKNNDLLRAIDNAKDESETTRRNYESQIKTLSEHLAQLSQHRSESMDTRTVSKKGFFR